MGIDLELSRVLNPKDYGDFTKRQIVQPVLSSDIVELSLYLLSGLTKPDLNIIEEWV